jgi:hypothetical protein
MPGFMVDRSVQERAQRLLEFVKGELEHMPVEGRFVFTIEVSRYLKPETDELKRRNQTGGG